MPANPARAQPETSWGQITILAPLASTDPRECCGFLVGQRVNYAGASITYQKRRDRWKTGAGSK
jgi:hypothetical protein